MTYSTSSMKSNYKWILVTLSYSWLFKMFKESSWGSWQQRLFWIQQRFLDPKKQQAPSCQCCLTASIQLHVLLKRHIGARYSVLLELEYLDIVRFTIIDCMHNLFLGTVKQNNVQTYIPRQGASDKRNPINA